MVQPRHIWDETPRVSAAWRARSADARAEQVRRALASMPQAVGFDVELTDERGEVILSSTLERPVAEEGALLMQVESHLRAALGEPVEVYFQQRQDENKPRQNRDVILEWIQRREELRAQGTGRADGVPRRVVPGADG